MSPSPERPQCGQFLACVVPESPPTMSSSRVNVPWLRGNRCHGSEDLCGPLRSSDDGETRPGSCQIPKHILRFVMVTVAKVSLSYFLNYSGLTMYVSSNVSDRVAAFSASTVADIRSAVGPIL
jgi:hypothetical protein